MSSSNHDNSTHTHAAGFFVTDCYQTWREGQQYKQIELMVLLLKLLNVGRILL